MDQRARSHGERASAPTSEYFESEAGEAKIMVELGSSETSSVWPVRIGSTRYVDAQ